jgi:hypothetical protein
MSLISQLEQELQQQGAMPPGALTVIEGCDTLSLELVQLDPLGVAFRSFLFATPRLATAETKQLTLIADQLAAKLTYLLEPLRVIEIDGAAGAVQMRSTMPSQHQDRKNYFEILVRRGGEISFERYEKQPTQARCIVPTILTREVLSRLTNDIYAATLQ